MVASGLRAARGAGVAAYAGPPGIVVESGSSQIELSYLPRAVFLGGRLFLLELLCHVHSQ